MRREVKKSHTVRSIDWITVITVLALVLFGITSLASIMASSFTGEEVTLADYLDKLNLEYVERQLVNFLVGLIAAAVILCIDYQHWKPFIKYVFIANLVLLVVLLLATSSTRGILGWFKMGTRSFQPSELCKFTLIIMLSKIASDSMERNGGQLRGAKDVGLCLLVTFLPFSLVAIQPDFGTAFVFLVIAVCILFAAKINWKLILAAFGALGVAAPVAYFFILSSEQKERIDMFLHPDQADPTGNIANVLRSQESIGSGQIAGKGFFTQGTLAQLKYIPERHTDFIFAGIIEGVGFVGGCILILLFFILIFRWLWIAYHARDYFGSCIAVGCVGMMLAHVFENIAMGMGIMPVTGIPLPFISYGGSNMLTNMMVVGLVMNVYMRRQARW